MVQRRAVDALAGAYDERGANGEPRLLTIESSDDDGFVFSLVLGTSTTFSHVKAAYDKDARATAQVVPTTGCSDVSGSHVSFAR